ncbi:hypothetical protein F4781DRAFT_179348 [Annulohypoxylon bovei var. microspora]|nr:hypothetical protein F4781DRAFT_179348 [Annulohypoxylon bovei var. microspora]
MVVYANFGIHSLPLGVLVAGLSTFLCKWTTRNLTYVQLTTYNLVIADELFGESGLVMINESKEVTSSREDETTEVNWVVEGNIEEGNNRIRK